ncbi:hypothetical protein LOK49_LG15G01526 [Camellia lanceoleosa]|uniref:Uncharacterized protein n=1 Tax=Camellia lanceoleosa TaxID=1840588 RepID=A0ACC0F346_9ERIC|nr:hypothetical protein LOK49_LG15G01526 [Camellia lanceoleosa]
MRTREKLETEAPRNVQKTCSTLNTCTTLCIADHPSEWSSELYPLGVSCGVVVVELRGPPPPSSLLLLLTSLCAFAATESADLAIMPRILSLICPGRLRGMINFGWILGLISIFENRVVNN